MSQCLGHCTRPARKWGVVAVWAGRGRLGAGSFLEPVELHVKVEAPRVDTRNVHLHCHHIRPLLQPLPTLRECPPSEAGWLSPRAWRR